MKIKQNADLVEIMKAARTCRQDVFFVTPDGDRFNLRSALSQFLFSTLQSKREIIDRGWLECQDDRDMVAMARFMET